MTIQQDIQNVSNKVDEVLTITDELQKKTNCFNVYLGSTGSGKSALTNYMHDAKLTFKKVGANYQIHQQDQEKYPKIGHLKSSCTQVPNICTQNGGCSADLVGWFDTQNCCQEIINGFSNASILKKGKKVKIVLVFQMDLIKIQRGGKLVEIVKLLQGIFEKDFQQIMDSTMLVFSKVNVQDWDIKTIKEIIQQIVQLNQNLNKNTSNLLQKLIQKDNIGIFPTPDNNEMKDYIQILKNKISNMKQTVLINNAKVSLSPQAIHLKNQFQSYLQKKSWAISEDYKKILFDKFTLQKFNHSSSVDAPLNQVKNLLALVAKMFNMNSNQSEWVNCLVNFHNSLQVSKLISDSGISHIKMIRFCKKLDQNFVQQYKKFAQTLKVNVNQTIFKLEKEKLKLYNQQQRKILQEKQRQDKIRQDAQNQRLRQESQARMKKQQEQRAKYAQMILDQIKRQYDYGKSLQK